MERYISLCRGLYYHRLRTLGLPNVRNRKSDELKGLYKKLGPPNTEEKEQSILICPLSE